MTPRELRAGLPERRVKASRGPGACGKPASPVVASKARRPRLGRAGRNAACPCGSGAKSKRCCPKLPLAVAPAPTLPPWIVQSRRRLHQFWKYVCQVFDVPRLVRDWSDSRRRPKVPTFDVAVSLLSAAVLRRPSINALEGDLKNADFQQAVGAKANPGTKLFSAEVITRVLDRLDLQRVRKAIRAVVRKGERNKAFRDGSYGGLRCAALDGWEPFASYDRHCRDCLTREVSVKDAAGGEVVKRTQYYHRCVVAMLVHPTVDMVLDLEPVLNADARQKAGEDRRHEGELTAAQRLIRRLKATYGGFIDALVLGALYANGPVMTTLAQCGYGGFIVLKKEDNEPLKEALSLWQNEGPCQRYEDKEKKESIDFWDADDIETLATYKGSVRVIRAHITGDDRKRRTWCFAVVGRRARKVSRITGLKITRARWHLENTGFGQWVKYWNLGRVYRHTANAIEAILLIWMFAFNLLQLFAFRRLKRRRQPRDPCDTLLAIVAEMCRDLGATRGPVPWKEVAAADAASS